MARIAVGGFQHETNTFAPIKADWSCFLRTDSFPSFAEGPALLDEGCDYPWPFRGALQVLDGHDLVPLAWAGSTPSAHVTDEAFERIADAICAPLKEARSIDGLYLDLHGAAVTESLEDAEGELLRRVRQILGPDIPIAISLDLHANLTAEMVEHCDTIEIYRTYPHVDMPATGARAAIQLLDLIARPRKRAKALRRTPFLIPVNWGCSLIEPAKSLYEGLSGKGADASLVPALAMGFPQADIAECGPAVLVTGDDQAAVDALADQMLSDVVAQEAAFNGTLWQADDAVVEAKKLENGPGAGPVIIADTQDNPGGGGPGDTNAMLKALIDGHAQGAVLATLIDPQSAKLAHQLGEGQAGMFELGGKSGMPGHSPLKCEARVLKLGDGKFTGTGPMAGGGLFEMGPMALIETSGIRIALGSVCTQTLDQSQIRHLGLEPGELSILVIKSSVHFRNDFQSLAKQILIAVAPGPVTADLEQLPYKNLRAGVRLMPST